MKKQLKNIVFELKDIGSPKFLIAICDDPITKKKSIQYISKHLIAHDIKVKNITIHQTEIDLVELLKKNKQFEVFLIEGFDTLDKSSLDNLLTNLNFKRDILIEMSISLVIWLNTSLLKDFASRAPDFWSRRTSTYHFTNTSVKEFLSKLFGEKTNKDIFLNSEGKIARALRIILTNETELDKLIKKKAYISPLNLDHKIQEINLGIDKLILECKNTKSLLVTLTLLNITQSDERYHNLYLRYRNNTFLEERNNILINISARIINILKNYKKNILIRVKEKKTISLLGYFNITVRNFILDFYQKEILKEKNTINLPYEKLDDLPSQDKTSFDNEIIIGLQEGEFSNPVEEFQYWLKNKEALRPKIFTELEEKILRYMYQESHNISLIAKNFGMSRAKAKESVTKIKEKTYALLNIT